MGAMCLAGKLRGDAELSATKRTHVCDVAMGANRNAAGFVQYERLSSRAGQWWPATWRAPVGTLALQRLSGRAYTTLRSASDADLSVV